MFGGYFNVRVPTASRKTAAVSAVRIKECPKCGTKKSGKLSCCARGGAWFQKCGDVGDTNFDNTWVEGVHACNAFASSLSAKAPAQVRRDEVIPESIRSTDLRHAVDQDINIYPARNVSDSGPTYCEDSVLLAKITLFTTSLFINLYL